MNRVQEPLLKTKLTAPRRRRDMVLRPRLLELLAEGSTCKLTLICAPAGYGKSTLLTEWIASLSKAKDDSSPRICWLSLDAGDNAPTLFLSYLVSALGEGDLQLVSDLRALLTAFPPAPFQTILSYLINQLSELAGPIFLVLDDYQSITNSAIHEGLAFFLDRLPDTVHLLIATRSDPPLPLARLRARGQMVELRAADLRFTGDEAAQFLNDVMGLRLDAGSVAALEERTEGWIAGLQMAALSMRNREDVLEFIEGFSGTNRYILDYLLDEVLTNQPPEIQRFLLYTSILERLTARLCDAVLASDEVPKREGEDRLGQALLDRRSESASILEYLERANLFLIPLDDERRWYRYHHLFADLLRTQLHKSLGDQGIARLHLRASEWYEQYSSILEAIHHASMASDDERVEHLIEQNYMEMVNRGEMAWLRFWTGKLSKELIYRRPWLCIYEAMSRAWFGQLDEADECLAQADRHLQGWVQSPETKSMLGHLGFVRSRVTAMRGDIHRAIELLLAARDLIPASDQAMQLDTGMTLGYEFFLSGDFANARPSLQETIRSSLVAGSVINNVAAHCVLARLYAVQGLLHKSYDLYQEAARSIPETSGEHLGARGLVDVGVADLLCEWNELDAALEHLQEGLSLLPMWDKADDWALAYVTLARIHLAQANPSDAQEAVEKATRLIQTRGVFSEARQAVEVARVKLWLAQGDLAAANHWAASQEERLCSDARSGFENELANISRARVYLAQDKPHDAIDLLSQLEKTARSAGRMGRVIEISLLKALALREIGDAEQALPALTKCLKLAEPERYARIYLEEGQPMQLMLAQWLAHADAGPTRDYAIRLLTQFNAETQSVTAAQGKATSAGDPSTSTGRGWGEPEFRPAKDGLVEPLSLRELEVLRHIAQGKTNREIAGELFLATGTVKAHAASIYRKLDVSNRTEAVARARQLSILP